MAGVGAGVAVGSGVSVGIGVEVGDCVSIRSGFAVKVGIGDAVSAGTGNSVGDRKSVRKGATEADWPGARGVMSGGAWRVARYTPPATRISMAATRSTAVP